RYGRRTPLMIDIFFYSVVEVLSGLAPTYKIFLVLRALYGIGMGGEWGVGASLAMEAMPKGRRGFFSGILQEGYAAGYLLAAAAYFFIFPSFGWRAMFFVGGLPALLTIYIRSKVPESQTWQRTRPDRGQILLAIRSNIPSFLYLILFMTAMSLISHGTQDMYPTFLETQRGLTPRTVATIVVIYQLGALAGGLVFGHLSDLIGRRRAIAIAALLGTLLVPLWIYPSSIIVLTIGAFLMQFMVQGAWGVIPAHLAEISPPQARGLYSGLAYQLGVLFAGSIAFVEALLAQRYGYTTALAVVAAGVLTTATVVTLFGREHHGVDLDAAVQRAD
ncbi:MAG: MFS transporter, partial [Candidatus Binataceae bacterium]